MDAEMKQKMLYFANETEPFTKLLGITVLDAEDGESTVALDMLPADLNHWGKPHGGALFTLCDVACGSAVVSLKPEVVVTVSATMDYLTVAAPEGRLIATGHVDRAGAHMAFCSAQVRDADGKLIARFHSVWSLTGQPLPL